MKLGRVGSTLARRGRRGVTKTVEAVTYEHSVLPLGITVAEYESAMGWPEYTVYPEARYASIQCVGYCMYGRREDEC